MNRASGAYLFDPKLQLCIWEGCGRSQQLPGRRLATQRNEKKEKIMKAVKTFSHCLQWKTALALLSRKRQSIVPPSSKKQAAHTISQESNQDIALSHKK
jgi:hypothetical protein